LTNSTWAPRGRSPPRRRPRARTAAPENRWSVYGGANYSGGGGEQQFLAPSYNYNAVGGALGLEYRVDPNLRLGAVFGYSAPDVNLNVQNAHDHIDSYQFAGYGSFVARTGLPTRLSAMVVTNTRSTAEA
jgi:outer membrane autotransporter protein